MNAQPNETTSASPINYALRIERIFDAPRESVFRAWTEAEQLAQWFHFTDDWKIEVVEIELRVGGGYRVGWRAPDGGMWYELAEFREIRPPERLVHTCRVDEPGSRGDETLVTIEFHEEAGRTRVVLVQEGYHRAEQRDAHQRGWPGFLDQLENFLRG